MKITLSSTKTSFLKVLFLVGAYFEQIFLAIDQLVNALIPPLDGTISYADETLSARAYRAYRDNKIFGKIFMKPINLLFFWQGPDHCYHAFLKEHERKNMPSEYRPVVIETPAIDA